MTVQDPQRAVAAMQRAKDLMDVEGLTKAIEDAAFLEETPGTNRQHLRASRTALKHLKKKIAKDAIDARAAEEAKEKELADLKNYDVADFDKIESEYIGDKWRMKQMPGGATMKPAAFYELYGLAQQGKHGDNTEDKPMWAEKGGLDFEGRERWTAWEAVKGMDQTLAKKKFLSFHDKLDRKLNFYG